MSLRDALAGVKQSQTDQDQVRTDVTATHVVPRLVPAHCVDRVDEASHRLISDPGRKPLPRFSGLYVRTETRSTAALSV